MSQSILLRRSVTPGSVPAAADFEANTLVINLADGLLYWRDSNGVIRSTDLLLRALAPLASPEFTGAPKAPSPTGTDNSTRLATTAFVKSLLGALTAGAPLDFDTFDKVASALGDDPNFATNVASALGNRLRVDTGQSLAPPQSRQARLNAKAAPAGFREGAYTALTTGQYVGTADEGRAFTWALASGQVGLPSGSTVFPGWWCQIRFTGPPAGFGQSSIVTAAYVDAFRFNGRAQHVDTAGANKGFVVVGGGEEFRFTWTGAEWLVEPVQSPTVGHFRFYRVGAGAYGATPIAFTVIAGNMTSGSNVVAALPFALGFYAPCDGLYRLQGRTRFFNDGAGNPAGAVALAGTSAADADDYDGAPYRSYPAGEYADAFVRCTKRLAFGQAVAVYKIATATTLKTSGTYEAFSAELISRG